MHRGRSPLIVLHRVSELSYGQHLVQKCGHIFNFRLSWATERRCMLEAPVHVH